MGNKKSKLVIINRDQTSESAENDIDLVSPDEILNRLSDEDLTLSDNVLNESQKYTNYVTYVTQRIDQAYAKNDAFESALLSHILNM